MDAIADWDDHMYEEIVSSPLEIVNFGENIDANVDSPELFEEYLIPYYTKRVKQLHDAGKFCHIHIDGSMKPLLGLMKKPGFDGIEAATPVRTARARQPLLVEDRRGAPGGRPQTEFVNYGRSK